MRCLDLILNNKIKIFIPTISFMFCVCVLFLINFWIAILCIPLLLHYYVITLSEILNPNKFNISIKSILECYVFGIYIFLQYLIIGIFKYYINYSIHGKLFIACNFLLIILTTHISTMVVITQYKNFISLLLGQGFNISLHTKKISFVMYKKILFWSVILVLSVIFILPALIVLPLVICKNINKFNEMEL